MKLHYWDSPARQSIKCRAEQRRALIIIERQQRQKTNAARRELAKSIKAYLYAERQRIKAESNKTKTKRFITEETRRRISAANKGRAAWNKGHIAWNYGKEWPDEVKQNISRGMMVWWIQRKEESKTQIV